MYYNGLYSLTIKVNYQTNLTKTITMRVERRKQKTGPFEELKFSLQKNSLLALFIMLATIPLLPAATAPFLLALIFFILGLLKLIENHMKLMEINPTLL